MKKNTGTWIVLSAMMLAATPAFAQTEQKDLYDMSLEELMNVSVVSASKEKERLFDAPVAVYSVTREEITKAGILSIPEALRLVPGVIVRETSNGNYDVHLRGFDNPARHTYGQSQVNTITLVMINNRPVFNYNAGGTLWESLPIDIADVERIEVVCGPSAPLFGPNAVSGVVNIITREFKQDQLLVSGQVQGSLPGGSAVGSIAVGRQFGSKFSAGVTGNYQDRVRLDEEQYIYKFNGSGGYYVPSAEYRKDRIEKDGLDYQQSLQRKGLNAYLSYSPTERIQLDYSAGLQAAEAQKVVFTSITPTTHTEANSFYSNLNAKVYDLSLRMSYMKGSDELHKISEGYTTAYDYNLMDITADYDLRVNSKLLIRPSLGYQYSNYSDLEHLNAKEFPLGGLINSERSMNVLSGSLRTDYTPLKGLRIIGSGRVDKFDVNDDLYVSYQFASTYAINEKWMLRAVHGKSYSGIFYNMAYIDSKIFSSADGSSIFWAKGNTDIKAVSNTLTELGLRGNLRSNLQFDLTFFMQKLENTSHLTFQSSQVYPHPAFPKGIRVNTHQVNNLPFTVHQQGMTLALSWVPNKQWQIKPFVTLQQTEARNFDFYNNSPQMGKVYNGTTQKHESTPAVFGGWYVNYSPISRLNLNTSAYFMGEQLMYHQESYYEPATKEGEIAAKVLLNFKASYQVYKKLNVFIGGKNMLHDKAREFYGTDRMGSQYFAGLGYNL